MSVFDFLFFLCLRNSLWWFFSGRSCEHASAHEIIRHKGHLHFKDIVDGGILVIAQTSQRCRFQYIKELRNLVSKTLKLEHISAMKWCAYPIGSDIFALDMNSHHPTNDNIRVANQRVALYT